MMLKRPGSAPVSKTVAGTPPRATWLRRGLAGLGVVAAAASLATACLDRPVVPSIPNTSNVFVSQIRQTAVDKIDLLFMIDNSVSMADKQTILKDAVPILLERLISPDCVSTSNPDDRQRPTGGSCPNGYAAEFNAIEDIHIGVVTSSLGAHGGDVCSGGQPPLDDKAYLLGEIRDGLATWDNSGFLAWDPGGNRNTPPGEANAGNLVSQFANMVTAAGERGCGYEASLEAWYRFLIDPAPPEKVEFDGANTVASGVDQNILAQREKFLRPDSLVAIVMLTDENDCSIRDDSLGWLVSKSRSGNSAFLLWRSTEACANNPNDPCCRSCATSEPEGPPSGCAPLAQDNECKKGASPSGAFLSAGEDKLNLRCYDQKRRFGFDLLYPVDRYVRGLTETQVPDRSQGNVAVQNPLYTGKDGKPPRDKGLVFLAGIVGVPWQDIADEASLSDANRLVFLNAAQMREAGRWDVILGDPANNVKPTDPLMIEQPGPRSGSNPITGDALAPPSSNSPRANPINGHEYNLPEPSGADGPDDLQYACIFQLDAPKDCPPGEQACDCSPAEGGDTSAITSRRSPLCQPPGGGDPGTTQHFAKAYPGLRHLQVLRDFGDNAIVASICPKITGDKASASYGYNPAVAAIIDRLKDALKGQCLPRPLSADPDTGKVPCAVVEATSGADGCDCGTPGRSPANAQIDPAVRKQLAESGLCGGGSGIDCGSYCLCEITQHEGGDLQTCQTSVDPAGVAPGYCYVDANLGEAQAEIVKDCPATQKRLLRFAGGIPAQGSVTFIACLGGATFPQGAQGEPQP